LNTYKIFAKGTVKEQQNKKHL